MTWNKKEYMSKKQIKEKLYEDIEIESNDIKQKEGLKINYVGVAILKQDFCYEIKYTNSFHQLTCTYYNKKNNKYDEIVSALPSDMSIVECHTKIDASEIKPMNKYNKFARNRWCNAEYNSFANLKEKPIYHCYLLIDIGGLFKSPIIFWSMKYKTEVSVKEMISLCSNTAKAIMLKKGTDKSSKMAEVIAEFKLKYGKDEIPIRIIDYNFAINKKLPGFNGINHANKKYFR
jgi:hypothetical protein